jgi:hypothetical protein
MFRSGPRHERYEVMERLTALVVGRDRSSQDWDFENADPARVEEFLDAYERLPWSIDERYALMKLVVASCNDAMRAGDHPPALGRVRDALSRDYATHFHTVLYWACLEGELEDCFAVTPMMREVYSACTPPLVLAALADDLAGLDAALARAPTQGELDDALLGAAAHASPEVVRRLLAAGASVQAHEEGGDTPLLRAASSDRPDTVEILLAAGSEVDAANPTGWTAAYIATLNGSLAALRVLLGAGANIHTRHDGGYDLLMAAAEGGRPEAIDLLLAHGARIEAINARGEHALGIAKRHAEYVNARADAKLVLKKLRAAAKPLVRK